MNCVILQPSYIPWRGFFHQIAKADVFVFCDDVQYDKRGWRNRNRIKTPQGLQWLTVPVLSRGAQTQHIPIHQIPIYWEKQWNYDHWQTLKFAYARAPYFRKYAPLLEEFYQKHYDLLADFTIDLTVALAGELGINRTRFIRSSSLMPTEGKNDRLLDIMTRIGATHYISGPSAQAYLDEKLFLDAGFTVEYMVYDYPEYEQLYPPYEPFVSILDLMFMKGPESIHYFCKEEEIHESS
jgi:hypothetical protein